MAINMSISIGENKIGFLSILKRIISEYYGDYTWSVFYKYMVANNINSKKVDEIMSCMEEFFGGSREVVDIVISKCMTLPHCKELFNY